MLTFQMPYLQYFGNISIQISPNIKKLYIFEIYTKRAVEKCPRWNFQTPRKPRNSRNKSGYSFKRHPVISNSNIVKIRAIFQPFKRSLDHIQPFPGFYNLHLFRMFFQSSWCWVALSPTGKQRRVRVQAIMFFFGVRTLLGNFVVKYRRIYSDLT